MTREPGDYAGLTAKQADLLSFLRKRQAAGKSPSFREMQDALGVTSTSGVHRLVAALVERGFIERMPNRARAIRVLPERCQRPSDSYLVRASLNQLIAELQARGLRVELRAAA